MITKNTRLYLKFIAFSWLFAIIFRIIYMVWQWPAISNSSFDVILKAFFIGIRFDGRIMAIISVPLLVFLFLPYLSRIFGKIRPFMLWFYTLIFFIITVLYIADFAHYSYLQLRSNFTALELLGDTKEALQMVWQTYPVMLILLGVLIVIAAVHFVIKKIFSNWNPPKNRKRETAVSGLLTLFVVLLLFYGQYWINYFPLRWSEAYFSGRNEITALALNPFQNIYDTKPTSGRNTFSTEATKAAYDVVAEYLNVYRPDIETLRYDRFAEETSKERPNIVLIIIESMSTHKSSLMFEELQTTPFLMSLANESLYFPNYYASARTTAKAVFSTVTGIPDANTSFTTSSRDPSVIDQNIIWNEFEEYKKSFMMGGSANWANIRGVVANNVPGMAIYEEGFWKSPHMDVWGISDLNLLKEAHSMMETQTEPFFSVILTASFHRPFTVPSDIEGLDYTIPDEEFLNHYGLIPEEYLSMRFCDLALQEFFRLAKESDYYENTIFIITGDHGISETSNAAGENYQMLKLNEYQVPLIIHYPKMFEEGKIMPQAGGHTDLFPTVAGLVGIEYQNTTLGRDLLDPHFGDDRWSFVLRTSLPPALVARDQVYAGDWNGDGFLFSRTPDAINEDWLPVENADPQELLNLKALSAGIEETARYMLYHNTKTEAEKAKQSYLTDQTEP